jgi:carboxymethylenebutenolidase
VSLPGRWIDVAVDDGAMRCYLAEPRESHGAGVLVCMHGPGVDEFLRDICERLASSGYAAIAPDLYHRQREPRVEPWTKVRDTEALRDMARAVDALKDLPGIDPERVGVVGFCMGGRLAFLHAANTPDLRAAVVFHGGNILVARDGLPSPFDQARNVRAPLLGLFGAEDENPSPADVQAIDAELTRLGKEHEFHGYAGAGHAFLNFTRPAVFREAQAKAAWAACSAWLGRHLHAAKRTDP